MIFSDESRGEYMIMASMQNKQTLSDMVFDVKEKLSDEEYKNIMEKIGEQKTYIKIRYMLIEVSGSWCDDCGSTHKIEKSNYKTICEVLKYPNTDDYFNNIHNNSVVEPCLYKDWKEHKDDKSFWPQTYQGEREDEQLMLICEFEEL